MTIQANIIKIKKRMLAEVDEDDKPTCVKVQSLALKAIDQGKKSKAWQDYMELFVDPGNEKQLKRLLATDGTEAEADMNEARAYLVAAGPCTPDTVFHFGKGVTETLDEGLG